jgi:2-polyprenyl-6-methoxyphenol hydroxylase-like FAD-dependent oxidoreductase
VLVRGLGIMEGYFPGLTAGLVARGANYGDPGRKSLRHYGGHLHAPSDSGLHSLGVSRPLLEGELRAALLEIPNVRIVDACDVLGLVLADENRRVAGVRTIRRREGSAEEVVYADLVVDAAGRGSRSGAWLEAAGYDRAPEEAVRVNLGYTSCTYRRRPDHLPGINAVVIAVSPPDRRGGVMVGQDGDRWLVSIGGFLGDHAPTDHRGLIEYARTLPACEIYDVIKDAEPLSDPVAFRFPSSLRRRYERLTRFPEGYLVFGDALCSFNPIYAQGMSVAALEAVLLGRLAAQGLDGLWRRFFAEAGKLIDTPWATAVGNDLRYPDVEGKRTAKGRFVNWYVDKLHAAAEQDPAVSVAFMKVVNLLEPPPSILKPGVTWRVLRGNLRRERRAEQPAQQLGGAPA